MASEGRQRGKSHVHFSGDDVAEKPNDMGYIAVGAATGARTRASSLMQGPTSATKMEHTISAARPRAETLFSNRSEKIRDKPYAGTVHSLDSASSLRDGPSSTSSISSPSSPFRGQTSPLAPSEVDTFPAAASVPGTAAASPPTGSTATVADAPTPHRDGADGGGDRGRDYSEIFGDRIHKDPAPLSAELCPVVQQEPPKRSLRLVKQVSLLPHLNPTFENLSGRVIFFRPCVARKSASGGYVERVVFVEPSGLFHLCDCDAAPKISAPLQAATSLAVSDDQLAIIFDCDERPDIVLRFDDAKGCDLASIRHFTSIFSAINPSASVEGGIVGGLGALDLILAKPAGFEPPQEIPVLSAPRVNEEALNGSDESSKNGARGTRRCPSFILPGETEHEGSKEAVPATPQACQNEELLEPGVSVELRGRSAMIQDTKSSGGDASEISCDSSAHRAVLFRDACSVEEGGRFSDLGHGTPTATTAEAKPESEPSPSILPCSQQGSHAPTPAPEEPSSRGSAGTSDSQLHPPSVGNTPKSNTVALIPGASAAEPISVSPEQNETPLAPQAGPAHLMDIPDDLPPPHHAPNRGIHEAHTKMLAANRSLVDELRRIDGVISGLEGRCKGGGGTPQRPPSRGPETKGGSQSPHETERAVDSGRSAPTLLPTSAGYHRAITLSLLVCEICRRQILLRHPKPARELRLPSSFKPVKNVIKLI